MIPLKGRKIALIGGAGFIGHNLALALKERGAEPIVIDSLQVNNLLTFASSACAEFDRELYFRMVNQRLELLRKADIPIEIEDARDYHVLSHSLVKMKPDTIIHLAAVAHAGRSNKDPYSTFDHSLRTLENTLDYSRGRVKHFIYFSSSMVYGNFKSDSVTEETPCEPLGIYGALKFSGEKIVIAYNQVFGLPYTIIRPSALYGARCVSRRVGQIFIENAMSGRDVVVTGDGSDRLDFTYIDDLTEGIIKMLENETSINEIFNLTYGASRSIEEMTGILREHFPHVKIQYTSKDNLTPTRGTLSIDKARRLLNYKPRYPLEKGMVKYIGWYKENFR